MLTGVPRLVEPARVPAPSAGYRLVRWLHRQGVVNDERMEKLRRRRGSDDYRNATGVMRDVLVIAVNEHYEDVLPPDHVPGGAGVGGRRHGGAAGDGRGGGVPVRRRGQRLPSFPAPAT